MHVDRDQKSVSKRNSLPLSPSRTDTVTVTPFPSTGHIVHMDHNNSHHSSNEKTRGGTLLKLHPSSVDSTEGPPPLNYTLHTSRRQRTIFIWFSLVFLEACVLPLILFYSLRWSAHLSITKNLAIITSLIGTVSGLKVAQRMWYLWLRNGHESRRPIGAGRWGVDFFQVLISAALTGFFVPLIIGSSLTPASVPIVSMAIPIFMLVICIPMTLSGLFPSHFRLPFRISSFPPYHPLPPLTYIIVEDIVAVDGGGKLEFRHAWRRRYEESLVMRKLLRDLAVFWGISGNVLAGGFIALAWTVSEDIGYGISYGVPWLWVMVCTVLTVWWVRTKMERERREWADEEHVHREKALNLIETELDRDVYEKVLKRRRTRERTREKRGRVRPMSMVEASQRPPMVDMSEDSMRLGRCTSV